MPALCAKFAAAVSAGLALAACQTTAASDPVEAVLAESSLAATAQLTEAVSKALGGRRVTLAADVLTTSSKLVMDPKFVDSRSMERPDHFVLMKEGKSCLLVHVETASKWPLKNLECQAL